MSRKDRLYNDLLSPEKKRPPTPWYIWFVLGMICGFIAFGFAGSL